MPHTNLYILHQYNMEDPDWLSSVSVALEVIPQLENVIMKLTSESSLVRILPFPIHNLEGYVLKT